MVKENETTVYLPGGTELEIKDNEIDYTITDHLLSQRLVVADDNALSGQAEYTPFGNSSSAGDIGIAARYTGMLFEPETATYDYHARSYDPTVVRFGSVDAIRASISPYSYTENNPINFADLTGLGKVPIIVFSNMNREVVGQKVGRVSMSRALNGDQAQPLYDAELLFGTQPDYNLARIDGIVKGRSLQYPDIEFSNQLFWFVRGKPMDKHLSLGHAIAKLRGMRPDLAEEIVVFNFSDEVKHGRSIMSELHRIPWLQKKFLLEIHAPIKHFGSDKKTEKIYSLGAEGDLKFFANMAKSFITATFDAQRLITPQATPITPTSITTETTGGSSSGASVITYSQPATSVPKTSESQSLILPPVSTTQTSESQNLRSSSGHSTPLPTLEGVTRRTSNFYPVVDTLNVGTQANKTTPFKPMGVD